MAEGEKRLYRVVTHVGDEYCRAWSEGQAKGIVMAEYRRRGCRRDMMRGWRTERVEQGGEGEAEKKGAK